MPGDGAPGRNASPCASSTTCSLARRRGSRSPRSGRPARRPAPRRRRAGRCTCRTCARCRLGVVLRHVVRAGQRAVLAAEALIVEVLDDAGDRILLVGVHRAAVHARRIEAVMAGRRDGLLHRRLRACRRASRPTARQVSSSSRPFRVWHAVTHALQPVQRVEVDLEARTAGPARGG